ISALATPAFATPGTVVASGDEWLLTNTAYTGVYTGGTTAFVNSITSTFGGTNYLLLTGDAPTGGQSGLTSFAGQLASLGVSVTYSAALPSDLSSYDAVFHIGQALGSTAPLSSYVANGGNLYLSLGGGYFGGAAAEANFWNPFLATYGLVAGSTWFTDPGFVNATVTTGPAGVTNLLWGYGQSVDAIANTTGVSYVRGNFVNGLTDVGLIGTSRQLLIPGSVPEPSGWVMMIAGFGLVGGMMRRRVTKLSFA
ncbi:MAG: PEPxxWA-CTERM sorting domain-containing protein, partial [Chakrabartia sp.]